MTLDHPERDPAAKLVRMANQIGAFFIPQGQDKAVAGIADHLQKFWDPRMRAAIITYLNTGGEGFSPPVRLAVEKLARESAAETRPSNKAERHSS
jgi:formate dehydrogenase subunit delta